MKLTALSFLVAGAGLAQNVASAPIRVVIVSNEVVSASPGAGPVAMRFGHAVDPNVAPMAPSAHRHMSDMMGIMLHEQQQSKSAHARPCPGMNRGGMRNKMLEISNTFRQALGLPLIEKHGHGLHVSTIKFKPQPVDKEVTSFLLPPHPHNNPYRNQDRPMLNNEWMAHAQSESFMRRFYFALMTLGPWEGRAVAFVLGCGIGVLLRMLWVLSVVSYRSLQGSDPVDEHEVIYAEELFVAPPHYTYTDEKTGDIKPKQNEEEAQT